MSSAVLSPPNGGSSPSRGQLTPLASPSRASVSGPAASSAPTTGESIPEITNSGSSQSKAKESFSTARENSKEEENDDQEAIGPAGTGAVVDMDVFGQLLEIDDDETHEFSKTLAYDYISQADTTFTEIAEALQALDLDTLSRKGHFLKGSSAALGLQRVQHSCESMQHFGNKKDENGEGDLTEEQALKRCTKLLIRLREEQEEAKEWLEGFYRV